MRVSRSLRLRLLAGAGIWVGLALALSGIVLVAIFEGNIEQGARDDLDATRNRLVASISSTSDPALLEQRLTDPRYGTPFGGLYWQVENLETGEIFRSRSLWDVTLDFPPVPPTGPEYVTISGPDGQSLLALVGQITFDAPRSATYLVTAAQDRADIEESINRFGFEMALGLLVLGASLLAAAWVQVSLGLAPLGKLAAAVESIRAGRTERLGQEYPAEVLPLVREVNELLAARDRSVGVARSRAAELAHSLKTPIAVVSAVADRLAAAGDAENADTLSTLSEEVSEEIDYHLRRTGIRPRDSTTIIRTPLDVTLRRTIAVLRKTRAGESLHWQVELAGDTLVDIDEHDLLELGGIILENAAKWAATQVRVSMTADGGFVDVEVADDGPGLSDQQIERLGIRGERPRDDRPGSGFGLAIALEIVTVNAGAIRFGRSHLGGLAVSVRLPTVL